MNKIVKLHCSLFSYIKFIGELTFIESEKKIVKKRKMSTYNQITSFRGEFFFLSNFYPIEINFEGRNYPTAEHAFQAAKCVNADDKEKIRGSSTPTIAKSIGRSVQLRKDWESKKLTIMEEILEVKFNNDRMKFLLQCTNSCKIVEQNYWHDNYWGVCVCQKHSSKGENHLGEIIMKIRSNL